MSHHYLLLLPCLAGSLLAQAPALRPQLPVPTPPAAAIHQEALPAMPRTAGAPRSPSRQATPDLLAARTAPLRDHLAAPSAAVPLHGPALPDRVLFDTDSAETLWALGHTWKAAFHGSGFVYVPFLGSDAPRNFPLRIELQSATVAGEPLALRQGSPVAEGARVRTVRGALTEVVDLSLNQVEQSFVFDTLPTRGAVAVEVSLAGEFTTMPIDGGLRFANEHGSVHYTKALALDAAGNQLPLGVQWLGDRARIEIPASFVANSTLPLVLDPLLTTVPLTSNFPAAQLQRNPDIAHLTVAGFTAVSWTRLFSAGDQDAYVQILDTAQNLVAGNYIDFTSENWATARIASNANTSRFLVVGQVDTGSGSYIAGRLINPGGFTQPKFTVEGNGVGLPGNNFRPDVGGDAAIDPAAFYTVVFEHETAPGDHDIYYKQITQVGAVRTTNPLPLDTSVGMQSQPAIGEANGPTQIGMAMVAWQHQHILPPFDEDIRAAWLDWNGSVAVPVFGVATTARNERRPAVSSFANVIGAGCAAVVFEDDFGTDNDVSLRLFQLTGAALGGQFDLNFQQNNGAYLLRNQIRPAVDTDGNRFVITYSEYSGTDYDTYAATAAYLPGSNVWLLHDERAALGANAGSDDLDTRIIADWNFFTTTPNSEYSIVGVDVGSNDIELHRYGGWLPGAFYATFGSQCGALGITAGGAPTTGGVATFSLQNAGAFSGYLFGFPGLTNPLPCPTCAVAVSNGVTVPGPNFTWIVPADPVFVNAFTLSIQGWSFGGNACLAAIDLSNTIDFIIR